MDKTSGWLPGVPTKYYCKKLHDRYHELTGEWAMYHWDTYGSVEDFKADLREKIAVEEQKLAEQEEQ